MTILQIVILKKIPGIKDLFLLHFIDVEYILITQKSTTKTEYLSLYIYFYFGII